jgi:hypothetical protein
MERHQGIGIGGDDIGARIHIGLMHARNIFRRLDQRKGRPFRLGKGRADPRQFAAGAAIKDQQAFVHNSTPNLIPEAAPAFPSRQTGRGHSWSAALWKQAASAF